MWARPGGYGQGPVKSRKLAPGAQNSSGFDQKLLRQQRARQHDYQHQSGFISRVAARQKTPGYLREAHGHCQDNQCREDGSLPLRVPGSYQQAEQKDRHRAIKLGSNQGLNLCRFV